jgi:hypothetical protein
MLNSETWAGKRNKEEEEDKEFLSSLLLSKNQTVTTYSLTPITRDKYSALAITDAFELGITEVKTTVPTHKPTFFQTDYSETCEIRAPLERAKSVPNSEVSSFHRAICTENSSLGPDEVLISQDVLISLGCYSQVSLYKE